MVVFTILITILAGLATFWGLMRLQRGPEAARAAVGRFAMVWVPGATALIGVMELVG